MKIIKIENYRRVYDKWQELYFHLLDKDVKPADTVVKGWTLCDGRIIRKDNC